MTWIISQALMRTYENSRCSQAREEGFSAGNCSGGEPSAPLNGNPTQQAYSSPDKMTDLSRLSRFGMTFAPLMESRGEELLMWFREGFPAKTSVPQEKAPELAESGRDSGQKWPASLARYDRATHTLRTAQCSLFEGLTESSVTLPRSGTMRDGELWQRPMLVPITGETESGLWPTPIRNDAEKRGDFDPLVEHFPTPTRRDFRSDKASPEWTKARQEDTRGKPLPFAVGGMLSPDWVELLMGWPKGWTSLESLQDATIPGWGPDWEEGTPRVGRNIPARADRLKAIGNGQVPLCAAAAFLRLAGDLA